MLISLLDDMDDIQLILFFLKYRPVFPKNPERFFLGRPIELLCVW